MSGQVAPRKAVLAVRVSSVGQGIDGDSPEAQIEQGQRYAPLHNLKIVQTLSYLESASGDIQPMQHVIDFAIDPKNQVEVVLIKSIDRFTRAGATTYDLLKQQLEPHNVDLEDMYGVISNIRVNTLEHLGVKYRWSEHVPSRKTELLEAERAKDEVRDILTRMIGAEIRYARLGYWVREAPFGFATTKAETIHGKRCLLVPHSVESVWVKRMFELRRRGTHSDRQIVEELNRLGYRTRLETLRDKHDRAKIIGQRGGKALSLKVLWYSLANPIYAGINEEKWTDGKPVKCQFDGLVTIKDFNLANRGKIIITDKAGEITISRRLPPLSVRNRGLHSDEYPYKKQVMCPHCERPLYGSASRGKLGKHYPAYHCYRGHKSFRVPKKEFDATLASYVKCITIAPDFIEALEKIVVDEWLKREQANQVDHQLIDRQIGELGSKAATVAKNMAHVASPLAIKYMEEELTEIEAKIKDLTAQKTLQTRPKAFDMEVVMKYVSYFLEHLEHLLLKQMNPVARAGYFGVLFDKAPTFSQIKFGTPNMAAALELNQLFISKNNDMGYMVGERGLEPPRPCGH